MNDADPDVTELLADLTRELRRLQREVEPGRRRPRRPSPRGLARFTSEVAIPALILLLQTQIRTLELLRRTIRLAEGRDPRGEHTGSEMRKRAETLGQATLTQLDDALSEVQSAIEGRPESDRAHDIISEARDLREQIQNELDSEPASVEDSTTLHRKTGRIEDEGENTDPVGIDVEAELQSLKDQTDNDDPDPDRNDGSDTANGDSGSDSGGSASGDSSGGSGYREGPSGQ